MTSDDRFTSRRPLEANGPLTGVRGRLKCYFELPPSAVQIDAKGEVERDGNSRLKSGSGLWGKASAWMRATDRKGGAAGAPGP